MSLQFVHILTSQMPRVIVRFRGPFGAMSSGYRERIGNHEYRQTSNISRTLIGNKIVDHSDVVGASPVGVDTTTSSFST